MTYEDYHDVKENKKIQSIRPTELSARRAERQVKNKNEHHVPMYCGCPIIWCSKL